MAFIYETQNFTVEAFEKPHITREDGGHIKISPKVRVLNRQALSPKEAIELTRLITVTGEAMEKAMNERGVDIGRINYQDNGNWSVFKPEGPYFHVHIYGRAKSAKIQKYGDAIYAPHREKRPDLYENNEPLDEEDIKAICTKMELLFKEKKYSDKEWGL